MKGSQNSRAPSSPHEDSLVIHRPPPTHLGRKLMCCLVANMLAVGMSASPAWAEEGNGAMALFPYADEIDVSTSTGLSASKTGLSAVILPYADETAFDLDKLPIIVTNDGFGSVRVIGMVYSSGATEDISDDPIPLATSPETAVVLDQSESVNLSGTLILVDRVTVERLDAITRTEGSRWAVLVEEACEETQPADGDDDDDLDSDDEVKG